MCNKKVRVRIYLRVSHETTMVANIIEDLLRASNFRNRELGLKTCFISWIELLW